MSFPEETTLVSFTHTHSQTGKSIIRSVSFYILNFSFFFKRKTVREDFELNVSWHSHDILVYFPHTNTYMSQDDVLGTLTGLRTT
jgi:hypothetical protein